MGLALIPLCLIFLYLAYNLIQRFKYKLPPGPKSWPVIGNIYDVKPVQFRCFHEWAQTYGPIISFRLGSEFHVVVSNSELAKQVLMEQDQNLADRFRRSSSRMNKDGKDLIWADYGPFYVKVRKVCNLALFTPKKLEAHRPIREDEGLSMVQAIFNDCTSSENKGKAMTIRNHTEIWAFNTISRITFGKKYMNSNGEVDPMILKLKGVLYTRKVKSSNFSMLAEHIPWLRQLLLSFDNKKKEVSNLDDKLDIILKDIIQEYVDVNSKNMEDNVANQHFVHSLLAFKHEYDLGDDTICGLLWDMVIAGKDTIAIVIEWALAELIRNPKVQKKAQEELDRVIGPERNITEQDFSNLPYLQALVKESLRLHPPTPLMLPHRAKAHVKIGGYDIPKDSVVHVNVWALGRDPNVWEDVNEFKPERFLKDDVDIKGHDFRLLPFGAGRRICPGAQMGINLLTLTLGHLLHHFDWYPPNGVRFDEIDMTEKPGTVTYMSTPLQVNAVPRLPTKLYKSLPIDM